ncbi:MAG: response regulator [Planctomycetota bacterium]
MSHHQPPTTHIDVLYVDDFEPERALLAHRLRNTAIRLTALPSVDDAIAALNLRRYDAVLSDLYFASGRSGEELLDAARRDGLHTGPFIVLSGESDMTRIRRLLEHGASAVLTKPVDTVALPGIIEGLLRGSTHPGVDAIDPAALARVLPTCLDDLERARASRDGRLAERVCRDLASTASGYGLTMVARTAEQAVGSLTAGITSKQADETLDRLAAQLGEALRAVA